MSHCDCIIVNYNAGHFLTDSVQSAFLNGIDQVIVVDNHSTDDSLTQLNRFTSPPVTLIRNNKNLGFAAACNQGLQQSTAEYILFLNPDCQLSEGALDKMRDFLASDPRIGMVGGFLCYPDGQEQPGGRRDFPTPKKAILQILKKTQLFPQLGTDFELHTQPKPDQPVLVEAISGACMLVKQEALQKVGLWDEGYFLHCEDLDWCMRFQLNNWHIGFVPEAKVIHAKGVCSVKRPLFVEWHKHLGMLRFYKKFFYKKDPLPLALSVFIGIGLKLIVTLMIKGLKTRFSHD